MNFMSRNTTPTISRILPPLIAVSILSNTFPKTPSIPDALHLMAYNYDAIGAVKLAEDARIVLKSSYPGYISKYELDN